MKRLLALVLLAALLAALSAGCAEKSKYPTDNAYHAETDSQFSWYTQTAARTMAETPEGYYYLCQHTLYFVDKTDMSYIPVCAKPNCSHTDKTCDACFEGAYALFCWEGRIYIQCLVYKLTRFITELVQAEKDGSGRKTVLTFAGTNLPEKSLIHRGYFYAAYEEIDESGNSTEGIWRYSLNDPAKPPELLCEIAVQADDYQALSVKSLYARGHYLYIFSNVNAARIDLNSIQRGMEMLFEDKVLPDSTDGRYFEREAIMYPCFVEDQVLFSMYYKIGDDDPEYYHTMERCGTEPLTTPTVFLDGLAVGCTASDGQFIYRADYPYSVYKAAKEDTQFGHAITIYDSSGELLESFSLPEEVTIMALLYVSGSEYVFLGSQRSGIWYFSKSEIGSGNVQVHLLMEDGGLY